MPFRRLLLPLLLAAVPASPVHADGLPLGPAPGEALARPAVTADGHGGAVVSYKTASLKLGAVHVNGSGVPDGGVGFAPAPMPFTVEASEPVRVSLPGPTQVLLAADRATASTPVVTSLGTGGGPSPGFPVGLAMAHRHPVMVQGLGGRTLIVSKNSDAVTFWTLRAAIIGADGAVQSSVELPSSLQFFNADRLDATTDGAGGLIAVFPYYDAGASGSKDIAVFRYTAGGTRPWGDVPRPVVFAANDQTDPHVVDDGAGGVLFAWTDPRMPSLGSDIYALHLDANAQRVPGWQFYGQPVCQAIGEQSQPRLARDGAGGAWVVWKDQRDDVDGDLRYQHVFGDGTFPPGFTSTGSELCTAPGLQGEVELAADGAGGFFAAWRDDRSGTPDIYLQHVLATGAIAPGWEPNGRALTTAAGAQDEPSIAAVAPGRVVVAWRDARTSPARIFATAVVDAITADAGTPHASLRLAVAAASRTAIELELSLPGSTPARVELLDVSGRVRARQELAGPFAHRTLTLLMNAPLEPGLYFARVRQAGASAQARATVLR